MQDLHKASRPVQLCYELELISRCRGRALWLILATRTETCSGGAQHREGGGHDAAGEHQFRAQGLGLQ